MATRPFFFADSVHGEMLRQVLSMPRRTPFYFSAFFRSTHDPSSPYLIKTDVFPRLPVGDDTLLRPYDVESARYPLIHEVSSNLRKVESLFAELNRKQEELKRATQKLTEYALKPAAERSPEKEKALEPEKKKVKKALQDIRALLDRLDGPVKALERWALQDGKDKAVSREAALDMVFNLYRANETAGKAGTSAEVNTAYDFLRRTQERLYNPGVPEGLSFGVAVVDLNVTGPNAVNRDLGELVLEQTYEALREHFPGSVVSKGTRTNFRIVNPEGKLLTQGELLRLEGDIHTRIAKKVEATGNSAWKRFVEGYRVGLSAGYSEVQFQPEEIRVGSQGEYELESVNAMLKKVDYAFRVAAARSQEITVRLKGEDAQKDANKAERLHYGQMPISDLNGIPEGRYLEPGEAETVKQAPVRLVHNIRGLSEGLKPYRMHLNTVERFAEEPGARAELVKDVLVGFNGAPGVLDGVAQQYYSVAYDVSHDLRMPRLVERGFAAERVDTVIRETGGAHLMFVELGQFYSFVRSWHGGESDVYVHDLIYKMNRALVAKGLVLMHPANQAPLIDDRGRIAVDPKWGQYFQLHGKHEDSVSGIKILRTPGTKFPTGSEIVLAMRDGDELGFVVGDRKADGTPVTKDDLSGVFREWQDLIRKDYGHMLIDDIQKVGEEKTRTPSWQRMEFKNGKVGKHIISQRGILMQEADITADYTGWVVDYEPVKPEPTPGIDPSEAAAAPVSARRARWRYFEGGEVTNKVFSGETILASDKLPPLPTLKMPQEISETVPELVKEPILAKEQTRLSAGFVSVDLKSGADLDQAWKDANDLSKKSKEKKGEPLFLDVEGKVGYKPAGHQYDKNISGPRSLEVAKYFEVYAKPGTPELGKPMGAELKKFLAKHGKELGRLIDPLKPKSFERQLEKLVKAQVPDVEAQKRLLAEIESQLKEQGSLIRVRDGLAAAQIVKREGLSLDYRSLGPALWTALGCAEKALGSGDTVDSLRGSKADFVKRYVQQTGEMPPAEVVAEGRKYLDPRSVFIPEEIFSLAKQYKVAPERVPYLVAGLKADEIRKMGQEAFRGLTYEDLKKLADSPEGQAFLNSPKNAALLQDTLHSRLAYQGVPLVTSMALVFPSEMVCKYLAEKIGAQFGYSKTSVEELKFGMTLYMVHTLNITASGAWEVVATRTLADRALVRSRGAEGMKSLTEVLKLRLNGGVLQGTRLAGQELVTVGVKSGDSLAKAMGQGILEKWGWRTAEGAFSWKLAAYSGLTGTARVPFHLLRTMGPGYLSATIFDRTAGIWLKSDHPARKWGSFVAFFAPDLIRLGLGSSRIAASPFLSRAGGLFTKAGNRLLAIAIMNYGFKRLVVDDDYQSWVNRRVTDQIYDKYVYSLSSYRWYEMPLAAPVSLLRRGARYLAPDAMEWAVGVDHTEDRKKILDQDLANSKQITQGMGEILPKLMALPAFYKFDDPEAYKKLDFSVLTKPIELNAKEQALLKRMGETEGELPESAFSELSAEEKEPSLLKIQLYQIQQGAKYLLVVNQAENAWARNYFNEDGTLIAGKGELLLDHLVPAKQGEPSATDRILTSRQVTVGLAQLDGQETYKGRDMKEMSRIAGILDEDNRYVLGPAIYAALTLYTAQAYETKGERALGRVQELIGKLQVAYLKADEKERSKYLEALRCLGIEP